MVLNPALFDALRQSFGPVKVTSENVQLRWDWKTDSNGKRVPRITTAGEQYNVCCPICRDKRFRLVFGHRFLTPLDRMFAPEPLRHNYKCYNEACDLWGDPQGISRLDSVQRYLESHRDTIGLAAYRAKAMGPLEPAEAQTAVVELPPGFQLLDTVPLDHPANAFIRAKYNLDPYYLAKAYGVGFVGETKGFLQVSNRIVFPVTQNGVLKFWQGRTYVNDKMRWYLPGGTKKVIYNRERVPKGDVVVIAEGIPAAIACGPTGTAIFGKDLDYSRLLEIVQNFRTAVIATDPETQIPDPRTRRKKGVNFDPTDPGRIFADEMKAKLVEAGMKIPPMLIRYPDDVMARARKVFGYKRAVMDGLTPEDPSFDTSIPDPADLGMAAMQVLLRQLPMSHRSFYLC